MRTDSPSVRSIFDHALDLADEGERAAYLADVCGANAALRAQVDSLLAAHGRVGSFLGRAAVDRPETAAFDSLAPAPGQAIGHYTLVEQIGEGGFGVVFLAEQSTSVRRKVALKIIKPGMDTREVIARFEAERQALAMMDHPNIAKVYDAGTTENGRPYFVMELVQGVPITDYCDQCTLATGERLELFITVCQAVQHAHQKGIIHRDLKPTNVLVTIQDGKAAPKIIDFGVAKAVGEHALTERTLTTAFARMVGTPMYMSPEQAELSPLGVDTRSDIYSLGVMLYELLSGSTPFDKDRLHAASYDELRRIIREEEPPRPSARLSSLSLGERDGMRETANLATTIAEHRRADPRRLQQAIRGELDWIVMKCLEKDRNRRYDSAGSLARDVERYLADEPVQACPPSANYRLRKFIRRNKVATAFMTLLVASVAGLAASNVAINRERDAKAAALAQAMAEMARTQAVSDALSNILGSSFPSNTKDATYTLREALDEVSHTLHYQTEENPEIEAAIRTMLGQSYWRLGLFDQADQNLKRSVELHELAFGDRDLRIADSMRDYAWNLGDLQRFTEAQAYAEQAAVICQGVDVSQQATTLLADALYISAMAQLTLGDLAGYRSVCNRLVDLHVDCPDIVSNSRPAWPLCIVPNALTDMSRLAVRAEQFFAENSSRDRPYSLSVFGAAEYRAGRLDSAERLLEESLRIYPREPASGRDTATYQRLLLAMTKWQLKREAKARELLEQARTDVADELRAPSTRWNRRTTLELLLNEAEALIAGPSTVVETNLNNPTEGEPVPVR